MKTRRPPLPYLGMLFIYAPRHFVNSVHLLFPQLGQVADGLSCDVTGQVGLAGRVSPLISQQLAQAGVGLQLGPGHETQPWHLGKKYNC